VLLQSSHRVSCYDVVCGPFFIWRSSTPKTPTLKVPHMNFLTVFTDVSGGSVSAGKHVWAFCVLSVPSVQVFKRHVGCRSESRSESGSVCRVCPLTVRGVVLSLTLGTRRKIFNRRNLVPIHRATTRQRAHLLSRKDKPFSGSSLEVVFKVEFFKGPYAASYQSDPLLIVPPPLTPQKCMMVEDRTRE
jgi:hypothetical protein